MTQLKTLKDILPKDAEHKTLIFYKIKQQTIKWVKEDIEDAGYNLDVDKLIGRWIERLNLTLEDLR